MKNLISHIKESLRIGICDEVKIPTYESLRIGINDTPEADFPEELETIFVLYCGNSFVNKGPEFRFEEYSVNMCKDRGQGIYYMSANSVINKNVGFAGFNFTYDQELNLLHISSGGPGSFYIAFFPNDERIQRIYPIFANVLNNKGEYPAKDLIRVIIGIRDYDRLFSNLKYSWLNSNHKCTMSPKEIKITMHKLGV